MEEPELTNPPASQTDIEKEESLLPLTEQTEQDKKTNFSEENLEKENPEQTDKIKAVNVVNEAYAKANTLHQSANRKFAEKAIDKAKEAYEEFVIAVGDFNKSCKAAEEAGVTKEEIIVSLKNQSPGTIYQNFDIDHIQELFEEKLSKLEAKIDLAENPSLYESSSFSEKETKQIKRELATPLSQNINEKTQQSKLEDISPLNFPEITDTPESNLLTIPPPSTVLSGLKTPEPTALSGEKKTSSPDKSSSSPLSIIEIVKKAVDESYEVSGDSDSVLVMSKENNLKFAVDKQEIKLRETLTDNKTLTEHILTIALQLYSQPLLVFSTDTAERKFIEDTAKDMQPPVIIKLVETKEAYEKIPKHLPTPAPTMPMPQNVQNLSPSPLSVSSENNISKNENESLTDNIVKDENEPSATQENKRFSY